MELNESKLFEPLKVWLNEKGYKVYSEVRNVDVVADNGVIQIALEMKVSCTKKVIYQAQMTTPYYDGAYVVVSTQPKPIKIEQCRKMGLGVLKIKDGIVFEILQPEYKKPFCPKFDFSKWEEGTTSGMPVLKGSGIAQDCLKRIKEYLYDNPNANWKEIYKNVRNHYSNHTSMRTSMGEWQGFYLNQNTQTNKLYANSKALR